MKKNLLILLLVIFSLMISKYANAGGYIFGTVGNGGEMGTVSYGGEIGVIWPQAEPKYLIGLGGAWAHTSYRQHYSFILDKVRENEYELYGAAGISLVKHVFIVVTAGFDRGCEGYVIKGDSTSACEATDDTDVKTKFAGSGQLRFVYKHLMIGAGYDNIRGIIGGIGLSF